MKKFNIKRKPLITFLLIFMLTCSFGIVATPKVANAETTETKYSVNKIIDESFFITFKKYETEGRGRTLTACFYIPNTYFEPTYTYGVMICPQLYIERFITRGDYINEFKEQGKAYLNVVWENGLEAKNGKVINCAVSNIRDANVNLEFVFALYVKDEDGNYAYSELEHQTYATSTALPLTYDEEIEILEQRLIDARLEKIERKTEKLSNSIFIYLVIAVSAVAVIWGAYIGIRILIAKKKEEKIDSRGMVKRFVIGIVILFVLALACPLLIKGLGAWVE